MNDTSLQETIEHSVTNGYHFIPNSKNEKNLNTTMQDLIEYAVTCGKGYDERPLKKSCLIKKLEVLGYKMLFQKERQELLESNADTHTKLTLVNESLVFEKEKWPFGSA